MANVYIHRELESTIMRVLKQFPAVALTGPRQSGKSTLLKKLLSKTHSYLSFDDPLIRTKAMDDPRLFLEQAGERIILDEIQYFPQILSYVKMLIDQKRNKRGRFIFTGSQQFHLIKALGDSLAGRIVLLELFPFSIEEKKKALRQENFSNTESYFTHACLKGSFPETVVQKNIDLEGWYSSYLQTYLERDVRSLYNIGNLQDFQRFIELLAARCSQILHLSSFASDLGVSVNTIKRWISILEASRMIYLLSPYYQNLGKRTIKSPKVYFLDCGLLCYLLSIRDKTFLLQGPLRGALFENFCIQETIKYLPSFHRNRIYYFRSSQGLEIDLLLEKDGKLFPVEFKFTKTPKLEFTLPMKRFMNFFTSPFPSIGAGTIVTLKDEAYPLTREISLKSLDDYLSWIKEE